MTLQRVKKFFRLAAWPLALAGALLCVASDDQGAAKPEEPNPPLQARLGGGDRLLAYLSTDKPIYKSGENVYMRGVALEALTNLPAQFQNRPPFGEVTIKGPRGDIVAKIGASVVGSALGASWTIPNGQPGGQYTVTLEIAGSAPAERSFEIRAYNPPRLKTQIEFVRKGYGPGDTVKGAVNIRRAEGGIPVGAQVTAVARVDGAEIARLEGLNVDSQGNCAAEFKLPDAITTGDGTLAFLIEDGGVVETASKTIPILLQNFEISFYPEGGELVAGLPCRVYVQARRADGKPADIEGSVSPQPLMGLYKPHELKTLHEGRGYFDFTPLANREYVLTLSKPAGCAKTFNLPAVKSTGVAIRAGKESYPYDIPIALSVNSTVDSGAAKITLNKREVEIANATIEPGKEVALQLDAKDYEGVLMATVWDAQGKPLAERLIFRQPKFAVTIKVTPEAKEFVPGGKVKLNIETTDAKGSPVEAVVGLTVTDESVLEMIDKREQAPRLPVMVYLENEVKDLADAQVYFDAQNPDAARDIDLLLGTQGWRRFIAMRYDELLKSDPEAAKRALAQMTPQIMVARPMLMRGGGVEDEDGLEFGAAPLAYMAVPALAEHVGAAGIPVEDAPGAAKEESLLKALGDEADELRDNGRINADRAGAVAMPLSRVEEEEQARRIAPFVTVREYAHQARPNRQPNDRVDFAQTLYWTAGVRTNSRDGKAQVEFDLADSVTTYSILSDAFGTNGALGQATHKIESVEPFYIEPKLPVSVTAGDLIELPVALINSTDKPLAGANLIAKGDGLEITQAAAGDLQARQRARRIVRIKADKAGSYTLTFSAAAAGYTDTVTRTLIVNPRGFPVSVAAGGLLSAQRKFSRSFAIPATVEAGSLSSAAKVYPSPLANMEEALNALLRQPHGCFEQTSSTNYPLVMAQQYFTSHQGVDPDKIRQAAQLLDEGYKKLVGFECKQKGYEWFGGDPGHEALTAYGLMQFTEMARLMPVDSTMLQRTREWLLARRDGKGGFLRNERALDSFGGAPVPTTNAYILWTLLESGEDPAKLQNEINAVKQEAQQSKDSYIIALGANILFLAKDNPAALALCAKLKTATSADGHVDGADTSITRSGGESLQIETTSLAILAWLRSGGEYAEQVEKSMQWLFEVCKAGRFGTTQSTILALKAINAYDKARAKPKAAGSVQLVIDGNPFGKPVAFTPDTKGAINLPDFSAALTAGEHTLELIMSDGSEMPFGIELKYNTLLPVNARDCNVALSTKLSTDKIAEGEPLEMQVAVTVGDKDAPTPVAIIGVPAGLEPRHDHLKELVKSGRIASYEILGQEVVLYWRALKAGQTVELSLSLTAEVPGTFSAPASRAYLYYTDELKNWIAGEQITISPK